MTATRRSALHSEAVGRQLLTLSSSGLVDQNSLESDLPPGDHAPVSDQVDLGGPLPQVDPYNTNQHRSLKRLNAALIDDLRFRDERIDDFGVDGSIEVHVGGRATNLRGDVQLKSMEQDVRNKDGSLSFSADVSNLVYLLNGRSPLYVIYVLDTDSLLYVWVRDEAARIESENANWKAQTKITIRFRTALNTPTCEEIKDRILREGVFRRQVSEFVSKAAGGTLQLHIDPSTFKVVKREDVVRLVVEHGVTLAASGAPQLVMDQASSLTQSERELPAVALALGYAEYVRGRYAASDGHLASARLRESELDPQQQLLLLLVSNACDLELGRISRGKYLTNEAAIVGDTGPLARQLKAKVLWHAYLEDRHPDRVGELVANLATLFKDSAADSDDSAENRFHLAYALLTAETDALLSTFVTTNAQAQMAARLDLPWISRQGRAPEWRQHWDTLVSRQKQLAADAVRLNNPVLMGRANALLVFAEFQRLLSERLMVVPLGVLPPDQAAQIYALMPTVDAAQQLAVSVGDIEEEIRLTLRLADMYMAVDNDSAAKRLATGVLSRARALRLGLLVKQAEDLLRGDWFVHTYEQQLRGIRDQDEDELLATEPDEALDDLARSTIRALGLPDERLATIRSEHEMMRLMARERLSFCRHLSVIQDLAHSRSQAMFYADLPDQMCRCALYGTESSTRSKDVRRLLDEFKVDVCSNCLSRSPKKHSAT